MLLFIAHSKSMFFFSLYPSKNIKGFTLIEALIVVAIVGILSAIAAPSFLGMYNRSKTNSALNQVRGDLQEAQRQAIRYSKNCTVALTTGSTPKLTSNCFQSGDGYLPSKVTMATNITNTGVVFNFRGTVSLANSGTIVFFPTDGGSQKKCLVVSSPLGLIRTGNYSGATATNITNGTCTTPLRR
jgi:prepilin-type N-terminal cleavage/methylation domain-containing protein